MGQPLAGPLFGKDNLPADFDGELGGHAWAEFRKLGVTKALRIEGTFRVLTIHGGEPQVCHDGWLAIDNQGHPYPINREVFERSFEPVGDSSPTGASVAGAEAEKALNHLIIARRETVDPGELERINAAITATHKVIEPEKTSEAES